MKNALLSLLSDALHERTSEWLPDESELKLLLSEAGRHGVAAAVIQALSDKSAPCVRSLEAKLHAVDMAQDYEGTILLRKMAERGIPCIPLKGWVLRDYYPRPYMRTKGDLDLLLSPDWLQNADRLMQELGYSCERENYTDYHLCYTKPPCLTVELHVRLTESAECPVFDKVWERAVPGEDGCFKLCDEDFYLFLIYHAAKHALLGGIGLRYITDLWVLLRRFALTNAPIRQEQVSEGLSGLGLTSFAAYSEQLASEWFGSPGMALTAAMKDSEAMRLWQDYVLSSGAFGGAVSSYENQLTGRFAPALAAAKLFPSRAQMEIRYPVLRQKPFLLPIFWLVRLWEKLRGGEALTGALALTSASRSELERRKYLLEHLGLR